MGALRTGAGGTDGAAVHLPFSAVEKRLAIEAGFEDPKLDNEDDGLGVKP